MGGSGGGFFSSDASSDQFAKKIREQEESARDSVFEADLSNFLASLLVKYNDRDIDGIQAILTAVKGEIQNQMEEAVDLLFGGSVSKHTYVDGLSDVDTLVLFDKSDYLDRSPAELRGFLAKTLSAKYGKDVVYEGQLAVTLTIEGKTIQFLPALRSGEHFKIAASDGNNWSKIRPVRFAEALTKSNRKMDGKLVPCIKLAKAILSSLPDQRKLSGYHIESMAIDIFRNYSGERTTVSMLRHFFNSAPETVRSPIKDRSGQSVHVDDYLGEANSLQRRIVSDALGRISRRLKNADGANSLDGWKDLFS